MGFLCHSIQYNFPKKLKKNCIINNLSVAHVLVTPLSQ